MPVSSIIICDIHMSDSHVLGNKQNELASQL